MKKIVLFIVICIWYRVAFSQGGSWVWMNGSQNIYVTKPIAEARGEPSPFFSPRGLYEAATWTDLQGKFWIFGGVPNNGFGTSDMWMYDPVTTSWTWVSGPEYTDEVGFFGIQGVPGPYNIPSARGWGCITWTDKNGDLWLFGGTATDDFGNYERFGDLWRYNISSAEWTWMSGNPNGLQPAHYGTRGVPDPGNLPTGRDETNCGWADDYGNLWLFGGWDSSAGMLNDMWQYNTGNGMWAWMKGSQNANDTGSYGTMGVESEVNNPPGRACYAHWKDSLGNFYIYAGTGWKRYNDVWRFNPVSNNWTWMADPRTDNDSGSYLHTCQWEGRPSNRSENRSAAPAGCSNYFANYGGDLWILNTNNFKWNWISGGPGSAANFGIEGVPSPDNFPRVRSGASTWLDKNGNLWIFGGYEGNDGHLNDMWEFIPDVSCTGIQSLAGGISYQLQHAAICQGDSAEITISVPNTHISPPAGVSWLDATHAWLFPSATSTFSITGTTACTSNDTTTFLLRVNKPGHLNCELSDSIVCQGTPVTLVVFNEAKAQILPLTGVSWIDSVHALLNPNTTTTYHVNGVSTLCGSSDAAQITVQVVPHDPIDITFPADTLICMGSSIYSGLNGLHNISISNASGLYDYQLQDSTFADYFPPRTDTFYLSGNTSCGGILNDTMVVHIDTSGVVNYTLQKQVLCPGDSTLLTATNCHSINITPTSSVHWVSTVSALLYPDTNTIYHLTGMDSTGCGSLDSANVPIRVVQPGQINYGLSRPVGCQYSYDTLYLNGLQNPHISPAPYSFNTAGNYAVLYLTTNTTYTVTGQSVCGGMDTGYITLPVCTSNLYTLSKDFICSTDTAKLTVGTGISGFNISPATGITWVDSVHALLQPQLTTTYNVSGQGCEGMLNQQLTLYVDSPGKINYAIDYTPYQCAGFPHSIWTYGVESLQVSPPVSLYERDSTDYYFNVTPDSTTTYTVTGLSECGSRDTEQIKLVVIPQSAIALNRKDLCRGDSAQLKITGYYNVRIAPASIAWLDSDNWVSLVYLHPDTNTTYTLWGTDCDGHTDSFTIPIWVIQPGSLDYTVDTAPCQNYQVLLHLFGIDSAQVSNGGQLYWDDSIDAVCWIYFNNITRYTVTGKTICGTYDTAYISLSPKALPDFTLQKNPLCPGDSTTFTVGGLQNIKILPAGAATWLSSTEGVIKVAATTLISVQGTACYGPYDSTFIISVFGDTPLITASRLAFCPGDSAQLCAAAGFTNYNWNNGYTGMCFETKQGGNYYVSASDENNCRAVSNVIRLTEFNQAFATIGISGDTLSGSTASYYQWFLNGQAISGATLANYIEHAAGSYTLQITDADGCTAISAPVIISGINKLKENGISVYPNPSNTTWQLTVDENLIGAEYEIFDLTGQLVIRSTIKNQLSILEMNAAPGMYLLHLVSGGAEYGVKLVKF